MENIGYKRHSFRWLCTWVCSLTILSGSLCFAQKAEEPNEGELIKLANQQMQSKKYEEAIGTITTYLGVVDETTAAGVIKIAQDLRFRMIVILIENTADDRLAEAAGHLQDYIDRPLGEHPRLARRLLATCLYETEDYGECVVAVDNALRFNEDPTSYAGRRELTPDEADQYQKYLDIGLEQDYETEYTDEDITDLYLMQADSYYKLQQWSECIPAYEYVSEHSTDGQSKGYAIMQTINALIEDEAFERIAEWIPVLYRTPARYDIRVNLALMNVAAALYGEGLFDDALPLYRMILPREELIAYQEERLREMRIEADLPPEDNMVVSAAEALLFPDEDAAAEEKEGSSDRKRAKPKDIKELESLLEQVKKLPPYEIDIKYRMAQIYFEVGRFWEAVKFLDIVYQADPESETGKYSIHQLITILLNDLDILEEAEGRAFDYLKQQNKGEKPRQIAYMLTSYYHRHDDMASIKKLLPYLDTFVRSVNADVVRYDVELYYMQAIADLVDYKFADSEVGFKRVYDEFPGSRQSGNALYWYGISMLFQNKFADAYEVFESYGRTFPTGSWVDEASYQGGVCLFGMAGEADEPDYTAASNRFSYVIATYPDPEKKPAGYSSTYPEANYMRADLYGASGEQAKAEADYREAIKHASKHGQSKYAVFALAKLFKTTQKYDSIINLVEAYLDQWKGDADISQALFWIGTSKIDKGATLKDETIMTVMVDEVVDDYLSAIVEYGPDVQQDGVDMLIEELVKLVNIWLEDEKRVALLAEVDAAFELTDSPVLKLRLRVVKAMMTDTESILGRKLLEELENFEDVPPPVLAAICNISIELEDYSRAEELLDIFHTKFEDSDYVRVAYKLRCLGQYAEKDYEGAAETVAETLETFGPESGMYWAQLLKATLLLEQGKFKEAIEENMAIKGVPAWRGLPVARMTYQLGQVEEQVGLQSSDPETRTNGLNRAFGYYQRMYVQYKGYAQGHWAAEGYLASARCLTDLGRDNDARNTYIAMLYDGYVNTLPQADVAREKLGPAKVAEIEIKMESGFSTNFVIKVEGPAPESKAAETGGDE